MNESDYETPAQYTARLRYNGQCGALYGFDGVGAIALDGYQPHCTLALDHGSETHEDLEGDGLGSFTWEQGSPLK